MDYKPLAFGLKGAAVTALQSSLLELDLLQPEGALQELVDAAFGDRTLDALESFQKSRGLPERGTLDYQTSDALRRALLGERNPQDHVVAGKVVFPGTNQPASGLNVHISQRTLRIDRLLAETRTNIDGQYLARFKFKGEVASINLVVSVLEGQRVLYTPGIDEIVFNASLLTVVKITLKEADSHVLNVFETATKALHPFLPGLTLDKLRQDDKVQGLGRLQDAHSDQNQREFEVSKQVALSQLDPLALIQLKTTGSCTVQIPEAVFDMDYPGHYMRRHKAVGLHIPCTAGPYTSVPCTLTLVSNRYRHTTQALRADYAEDAGNDPRFRYNVGGRMQSVSIGNARDDAGLFELAFRDERYLYFEGTGCIATWQLQLPAASREFDYGTITDAILHLLYTARDGGTRFRAAV